MGYSQQAILDIVVAAFAAGEAAILLKWGWAWSELSIATANKMADSSPSVAPLPEGTTLNGCHVNGNGDAILQESREFPVTPDCDKENDPKAALSDAVVSAAATNHVEAGPMQVALAPAKKSGFVREFPRFGSSLMMRNLHLFVFLSRSFQPCWYNIVCS